MERKKYFSEQSYVQLYHKDTLFKNNKLTPHTHPNWKGGFAEERTLVGAKNKNTQLGVEVKRETSNNRRFIYTFFFGYKCLFVTFIFQSIQTRYIIG